MPRTVPEALAGLEAGLEADLRQVRLAPAAEIRALARRRTRRRRAGAATSALALAAAVPFLPLGAEPEPVLPAAPVCAAPVDPAVPYSLATVAVRVVDATGRPGAAEAVLAELRTRGFGRTVPGGTVEPLPNAAVGVVRYGPSTVGDAAVVRAVLSDRTEPVFEPARSDDLIDVVLGPAFQQLGTPTEVNQRLVHFGPETLPQRC